MSAGIWPLRRSAAALVSVFLLLVVGGIPQALATPTFSPGYTVINARLDLQPKWQRLLITSALKPTNASALWQDLHDDLLDKHPLRQLDRVNRYFNRIRYGEDRAIYGARDYWASPAEFIGRDFGDCEDYSIAKYAALRALGWSADSLLIVVVRDLKNSVDHAALAAKLDGQWYLLDNRARRVLTPADVPFYQPVYAVNENKLLVFKRVWKTQEASVRDQRERARNAAPASGDPS